MISWGIGDRHAGIAHIFMQDVAGRLANRVRLTSDGHRPYLIAVEDAFGNAIDFAQLVKIYGLSQRWRSVDIPPGSASARRETGCHWAPRS